jgi:hypothetical protein
MVATGTPGLTIGKKFFDSTEPVEESITDLDVRDKISRLPVVVLKAQPKLRHLAP